MVDPISQRRQDYMETSSSNRAHKSRLTLPAKAFKVTPKYRQKLLLQPFLPNPKCRQTMVSPLLSTTHRWDKETSRQERWFMLHMHNSAFSYLRTTCLPPKPWCRQHKPLGPTYLAWWVSQLLERQEALERAIDHILVGHSLRTMQVLLHQGPDFLIPSHSPPKRLKNLRTHANHNWKDADSVNKSINRSITNVPPGNVSEDGGDEWERRFQTVRGYYKWKK